MVTRPLLLSVDDTFNLVTSAQKKGEKEKKKAECRMKRSSVMALPKIDIAIPSRRSTVAWRRGFVLVSHLVAA